MDSQHQRSRLCSADRGHGRWELRIYWIPHCLKAVVFVVLAEYIEKILSVTKRLGVRYWAIKFNLQKKAFDLNGLKYFRQLLRMPTGFLPCCTLLSEACSGWKMS